MKYIIFIINLFVVLFSIELKAQKFSFDIYSGVNRTSISNILLGDRNNSIRKTGVGFQVGFRANYRVTNKLQVLTGLGMSNRAYTEDFFGNGEIDYEKMFFIEIPMMVSISIGKKFYTNFGLVHSYKFASNTHYYWNDQKEILYGIDFQSLVGYKLNNRFGIEVGALYGSLLDHALARLNITNFVGSLCLTYKLK